MPFNEQNARRHTETRRLGRTDLQISVFSIGGLYTSSLAGGVAETQCIPCRAVELGVNAVDTGPAYADSESAYADSEKTVGRAIAGLGAPLIIATKLGGRPQSFDPQNINGLRQSFDESLGLLGRDRIDVLMIHEPGQPQHYPWWTSCNSLEGPILELMDELKDAGKIRYNGLAGTTVPEMTLLVESNRFDVVLTAFDYNALYREASDTVLPFAITMTWGLYWAQSLAKGSLPAVPTKSLTRNQTACPRHVGNNYWLDTNCLINLECRRSSCV